MSLEKSAILIQESCRYPPYYFWVIGLVKFVFFKKATKIDEIFTVKLTVKILSILVAFLEKNEL